MKTSRQALILEIIAKKSIATQSQLQDALKEYGVTTTQATLSRDINELKLTKKRSEDGNYYFARSETSVSSQIGKLTNVFQNGFLSIRAVDSFVVIKTLPGLAGAAASYFDKLELAHLVGSIAGNDTTMLIMENSEYAEALCIDIQSAIDSGQ